MHLEPVQHILVNVNTTHFVAMAVVETSMHFLTRDKLYENEKPYSLKYVAAEGIPTSNIRVEKHEAIKVNSIRGQEQQFSLERNGFAVLKMDEEIPYDDFANPAGVRRYLNMVAEQLKTRLGADKVQVYQYVVRAKFRVPPIYKSALTMRRSENVIQGSQSQKKARSMNSLSHRQSLI